ncbi:MAG: hypothetical protein A3G49_02005 [Candidatus Sungbacteria bacterium RIFCSPLOWO2_12_FULL_41_11]|uniref:Ada DNA repair metal-binding domain-containing protein n=1 Tax=Candidatus Sungbacteria bacterium RIFCSPLOWO2_12_FULL_41_11 TaxID=1802286 RepID=A0A1G2LRV7_9BACT|nr:MAG: hypothetical protein UV01_C0007G0015 [Parcubacteria group bacterium GW2011_GWA2_42_14]OHA00093.1 MAG: hypothetical protein A3D41_00470 [Candidatus Sungbacteria bacterium RIFCSPHIGHO2_02_FULL_41_12b]OHA14378.1 MAG: hypothetical protein A3G49_02005 [Candidatus Sungbacteria bacterium RIFCSPLOWO2_12_FULL_41_11]
MLYHLYKKIKSWLESNQKDLFLAATIILVSIISFGFGRLSAIWPEKQPIRIEKSQLSELSELSNDGNDKLNPLNQLNSLNQPNGKYVASKNSTFYHYPWCPGAQKIKEENKIWFQTKEEAESRGYKPAGNCDGL